MDPIDRNLRYEIFKFILQKCRPPTVQELEAATSLESPRVISGLQILRDLHHITLYSDEVTSPTPIAMAHPFSHLYVVTTTVTNLFRANSEIYRRRISLLCEGERFWYANCAWCAFGLVAMLSPAEVTVKILTPSKGEYVAIKVIDWQICDEKARREYYTTFSPPPSTWWNDVRFACSTIQLCTSRIDAENWFEKHGFLKGYVMDMDSLWELSKAWYHDKYTYNYERKTPEEAKQLFESLGLTSEYWST